MPSKGFSPKTESSKPSLSPSPVEPQPSPQESGPRRTAIPRSPFGVLESWVNHYSLGKARADLQAGLTVAVIYLPQSMAYALIAGVDPRFGLFTAIVVTAIGAMFGSSLHVIPGPTGAVSLVVFSALSFFDPDARLDIYEGMFLLAAMIGAIQILIAVLKLGDLTRYISESVVTGFMVGAATLTIVGQVGNALGLKNQGTGHQHVFHRLWLTLTQHAPWNLKALTISGSSVVLALFAR